MSAGEEEVYKLIIKGLPFETNKEDLCAFLDIEDHDMVDMVTWNDNGARCKGHAFISCPNQGKAEAIKALSGAEFEADGNARSVKIEDYEDKHKTRGRQSGGRARNSRPESRFEPDETSSREVYVSNLSFQATEQHFKSVFGEYGEIEQVTIPKVYSSGRPKGFAFVRFATEEQREAAIEGLNGSTFEGRVIGVRANKGRAVSAQQNSGGGRSQRQRSKLTEPIEGCTTIYVGNLPWVSDEAELEELFSQFGAIKSTRVVRKSWTPTKSRGFGYVEFQDAAAMRRAVEEGTANELMCRDRKLRLDYAEPIQNKGNN
jgi:RNA recognition motif-containing protein